MSGLLKQAVSTMMTSVIRRMWKSLSAKTADDATGRVALKSEPHDLLDKNRASQQLVFRSSRIQVEIRRASMLRLPLLAQFIDDLRRAIRELVSWLFWGRVFV